MTVVAGIDEAGYGPLLGPLVSTVTVFSIPTAMAGQNLWKVLSSSISPGTAGRSGKICVADSKKLFSRARGLARLERTALTFMHLLGRETGGLSELLSSLRVNLDEQMKDYPWYLDKSLDIPLAADPLDMATCVNALRLDTKRNDVRFLGAGCKVLLVGRYNELVDKTRNKAAVLFSLTGRFLSELVRRYANKDLVVYIDKQGGRMRYRSLLQQCFANWNLRILQEDEQASIYQMSRGQEAWEVHFKTKAESKHLPVALASVYAKYIRELFIGLLNRYWTQQVPDLRPTAGYYTDGKRFLSEIETTCKKLKTPMGKLVRSK